MKDSKSSSGDTPVETHTVQSMHTPRDDVVSQASHAHMMLPGNDVSTSAATNQNMNSESNNDVNYGVHHGDFDNQSPLYLDSNWTSSLLMDPDLYNMEMAPAIPPNGNNGNSRLGNPPMSLNANSIMQNIRYQNNIHPETAQSPEVKDEEVQKNSSSFTKNPQSSNLSDKDNNLSPTSVQSKPTKQRRPCDHCRRKKTKCVIIPNTNNCAQCETKSLTCTFNTQALKRRGLDKFEPPYQKRPHLANEDTNGIVAPNVRIRDVPPVQDYSMMNNSLLKKTLLLQFPRSSFYVGPTSYLYDVNILNIILNSQNSNEASTPASEASSTNGANSKSNGSKVEQVSLSDTVSLRKVSDNVLFILKDDQSSQSYQTMTNDVDTIEKFIAPHGQILIDLYFRIIHPSYPILHKKVFLEKYSRTHREFSAPLIAAVYVLAIQWWDYDPQLNRFPKPNVELILKIGLNNYLLEILKRPKLSAVQAGLLLLQCKHVVLVANNNKDVNQPKPNQSQVNDTDYSDWVLCSQVVALAEELGLGLDCNNWKLPKWERGLRKRLAWAVYMEDKWLSLKNSRPSHINENNWMIVPLVEEDFPEKHGDGDLKEGSSDIENGKKMFQNLIELSMILSDILNQFYSMRAMHEIKDINQVLKIAKPLQLRLRNWYHSLPVELQMHSVQPRKLCSNGNIQLAYFATELVLHRKISTIIYQQTKAGNPPPKELVSVCRTAAKTRLASSIEFVRDLKPEHIHSFWYLSAASNFTLIGTFAALLFISSSDRQETSFYRDQIFNYRWILKISSKGFDQVAEASKQLDMVLSQIPGLLHDSPDLPMMVPNVPTINYGDTQRKQDNGSTDFSPSMQVHTPVNLTQHLAMSQHYQKNQQPLDLQLQNGPPLGSIQQHSPSHRPSLLNSHSFGSAQAPTH